MADAADVLKEAEQEVSTDDGFVSKMFEHPLVIALTIFAGVTVFSWFLSNQITRENKAFALEQRAIAEACQRSGGFVIWEYIYQRPYRVERCER